MAKSLSALQSLNVSDFFALWPKFKDGKSLKEYVCIFCTNTLRPPVIQILCGHRLCGHGCLDELRASGKSNCPGSDEECKDVNINSDESVYPDISISRELLKLIVLCNNKAYGCVVEVPWEKLEHHLDECEFKLIECKNSFRGCPVKLPTQLISKHQENECLYFYVECPNCLQNILKEELSEHLRECATKEKVCTFAPLGCEFVSNNIEELKMHREKDKSSHLLLLQTACEKLMSSEKKIMPEIHRIREFYTVIKKSIEELTHESKRLKEKADQKMKNLQKLTGKNAETLVGLNTLDSLLHSVQEVQQRIDFNERKILQLENYQTGSSTSSLPPGTQSTIKNIQDRIQSQDSYMNEFALHFQCLETTSYDGRFVWKISNYRRCKDEAINGQVLSMFSQPFYTSRFGYKLCLRLYPNGDGLGKGTHLSLFVVIMNGEYDALLHWPFRSKVKLSLMDQESRKKNHTDTFTPDPTSNSFKRPTADSNVAFGFPMFVPQTLVENQIYLKDDVIFVKADIDSFF